MGGSIHQHSDFVYRIMQMLGLQMAVDLCHSRRRMTEELLNLKERYAFLDKPAGMSVFQAVKVNPVVELRHSYVMFEAMG
jgi:hypothetical protein